NRTRAGTRVIGRRQFGYIAQFSPTRRIAFVSVNGLVGRDIDFENARPARGATVNFSATLQASNHLAFDCVENFRWLNVDVGLGDRRLLTQQVTRVKATYTFTSRLFVRGIGQYVSTSRDPALFADAVDARDGDFGG